MDLSGDDDADTPDSDGEGGRGSDFVQHQDTPKDCSGCLGDSDSRSPQGFIIGL